MSDIMPKVKLYLILSVFGVLIALGFTISKFAYTNTTDLLTLFATIGTAFIPFANTIIFIFTSLNMPVEVLAFIGIFTGIISGLQTYLLAEIILNHLPLIDI